MPRELQSRELSTEQFRLFGDYIRMHSGIRVEEGKRDPLRASLIARAMRWGCVSLEEYFEILSARDEEFDELLNLITINETSFFRFPAQFRALENTIIERVLDAKPEASRSFRVWSAGCATGEEPYSIAMTLLESAGLAEYRLEVTGTDVSTQALDRARVGLYPTKAVSSVPQELLSRYFAHEESGYRVVERVREVVEFGYHNLAKEPYPVMLAGNWDVIFCRNVTIYFHLDATRRVVSNFFDSLNPGGFLFLGHSESLTSLSDQFELAEVDGVFVYHKPAERRIHPVSSDLPSSENVSARDPRGSAPRVSKRGGAASPTVALSAPPATGARVGSSEIVDLRAHQEKRDAGESLVEEARRHLANGQPSEALRLAAAVLEKDPRDVDAFLVMAYAHADGGDFTAALEECRRILSMNPLVAAARFILGIIYQRLDEPLRAIAEFKRTLYIDPDFVLARFHLANVYRSRGYRDEACREYQNTLATLERAPHGDWEAFLDGFTADVLVRTSERALAECGRVAASG